MKDLKERIKVDLQAMRLTKIEEKQTYKKFVSEQQEQFEQFINYLNQYINELREQGVISPFLKFYARIKATKSALKNYEKKALDDIFGIEFICATDEEIQRLQKEMESILETYKVKMHNKENGYKAIHHLCYIKEETRDVLNKSEQEKKKEETGEIKDKKYPLMEVQYKTVEVYYKAVFGSASHEKYKDTKIPLLQELYDSKKIEIGEDIPDMWVSETDADNMRKLSAEEILRKMYPSLKLEKETEKKKDKELTI